MKPLDTILQSGPHPAVTLSRRTWWTLGAMAALLLLNHGLVLPALFRLNFDAPVINVAGRQRMLSQRLAKTALALQVAPDDAARRRWRVDLRGITADWSRAHRGLQSGDQAMSLPVNSSAPVSAAFAEIEPHFVAMRTAADTLIDPARPTAEPVASILRHERQFLTKMEEVVGLLETESRARIVRLQTAGWLLCLATLAALVAIEQFVLRPAVRLIRQQFRTREDQYETLVESMHDGLFVNDTHGRVLYANQRLGVMLGVPPDQLVNRQVGSLFEASSAELARHFVAASSALPQTALEIAYRRPDGSKLETLTAPRLLMNGGNLPRGCLVVVTDITELKQAADRTRQLQEQLVHASRLTMMGEMAAGLAHEINQPLGAIANFSEMCLAHLEGSDNEPMPPCPATVAIQTRLREPLRRILSAALRGGEIIHRVRGFSRQSAVARAPANLNVLIQDVQALCQPQAKRLDVALLLDLAPILPAVEVDSLRIQQVLVNLIQNGIQAVTRRAALTGEGRARGETLRQVLIASRADMRGGVEVVVSDTGAGFEEGVLEKLFQPFFTTRPDGLGMGLAISRSIVLEHGGALSAAQIPGGGARFRVTFPEVADGGTTETA